MAIRNGTAAGSATGRSSGPALGGTAGWLRRGLTLLIVTHDPELGAQARRRIQLVDGKIV